MISDAQLLRDKIIVPVNININCTVVVQSPRTCVFVVVVAAQSLAVRAWAARIQLIV